MNTASNLFPRYVLLAFFLVFCDQIQAQDYYYPKRGVQWEEKSPKSFGINEGKIEEAVAYAEGNEYTGSRDMRAAVLKSFASEPYHTIKGPMPDRGGPAGMILKNGYVIAQWGDTKRVDMTHSATKSYLSTVVGLAVDQGLIGDITEPVRQYVWDDKFDGKHNSMINWEHLLTQSSDWSGELWGDMDWADRPPKDGGIDDWRNRELKTPGTFFEYNDVRVNLLAYSLMQVWRKPLPMILKEQIMDPIGASTTWRWYGYDNSWVNVDGINMQSVSGGGHSGGGMFISAEDHARFGLLFLSNGKWGGGQLISKLWVDRAVEPSLANENYGLMWWLNPNGNNSGMSNLSKNDYYAAGFGGNYIVVMPDLDLVIVTRWLEPNKANEFIKLVKEAME